MKNREYEELSNWSQAMYPEPPTVAKKLAEAIANGVAGYDEKYDVHYYLSTGEWIETRCGADACWFCKNRPEKKQL